MTLYQYLITETTLSLTAKVLQISDQTSVKSIKTEKVIEQAKDVEEMQGIVTPYSE